MPYAMHSEYLYKLRRTNDLAEERIFATKKVKKAHAMTSATASTCAHMRTTSRYGFLSRPAITS